LSAATLSPSNVGIVMANGEVRVDGVSIQGNSNLFAGSVVQAGNVRSDIHLNDGTEVLLNPSSQVKIYQERSILEKGVVMQRNSINHPVIANGLRISPNGKNVSVMVGVIDPTHMEVLATGGEAEVRIGSGELVARVEPGKVLSFTASANGAKDASTAEIQGILRKDRSGRYLVTDTPSSVTFQVQGQGLEKYLGASVAVNGTVLGGLASASGPRIIQAAHVMNLNADYEGADGQMNRGARRAGIGPLFNTSSIIFLVVVAAGGTLLGLAAAGELGNGAPASRP
jgi:hypothetical protein